MKYVAVIACLLTASAAFGGPTPEKVVVNEYFGVKYEQEPVSWDIAFAPPVPAAKIGLKDTPAQVEVLEGTAEAVKKARVWTLVDFAAPGQKLFHVITDAAPRAKLPPGVSVAEDARKVPAPNSRGATARVANGTIEALINVANATYDAAVPALGLAGPVVSIAPVGEKYVGNGYLDTIARVKAVRSEISSGPVFWQNRLTYEFENDKRYTARIRIYPGKNYVQLVEDFNLGGNARYVFNYDDWSPPWLIACSDQAMAKLFSADAGHGRDFVQEEGQRCLVRLCVWTQFGYFAGKSETIGLVTADGSLGVGAFFIRPDLWTRAKVNHVDLFERPEVPGDRQTRGVVGLAGAKPRRAMEAWLIDGHREWALFAAPVGEVTPNEKGPPGVKWTTLRRAHVVEGVWPLDRLNRLPLVWNPDATPIAPEDTAPPAGKASGAVGGILQGMSGRSGLQVFNGSNPGMRGDKTGYLRSVQGSTFKKAREFAPADIIGKMVGPAAWTYMGIDDSAYPGTRAMLPWTDPEALNPFYQGMENMNFNADRYRCVSEMGAGLAALNHPEGKRLRDHGWQQMSMALDRYVYPQSGCWEESHSYAMHTIKNLMPLARVLKEVAGIDPYEDVRFAKLFDFFTLAHTCKDVEFYGTRNLPPIGDHGLGLGLVNAKFREAMPILAAARNPEVQKIARHMRWLLEETGGFKNHPAPNDIQPEMPDLSSKYLQGYGVALRAFADATGKPITQRQLPADGNYRESYLVLRAEQSWGHHHQDKGSLWGWFRNVHFFGDAAWGGPPGGTYGNSYKQGPASGTQIEFVGVNNWPLPCKYPGPWISDDQYQPGVFDYANARCMFPYNPDLDLKESTPVATRNGYDRQVLFVHPDLLLVRDNVESVCPTVWRLHSYQPQATKVEGAAATLTGPQDITGKLQIIHPAQGVKFSVVEAKDLLDGDTSGVGTPFKGSVCLRWDMPRNTSATWTFSASGAGEKPAQVEALDKEGRATRIILADGREIIALLNIEPFTFSGHGVTFDGTVGLVIKQSGKATAYPVRAKKLEAK